jgi:hypothetical protein
MLIATNDDELLDWLLNAANPSRHAGHFVRSIAEAGLRADVLNYRIIRPALLELKAKYPNYAQPESERD